MYYKKEFPDYDDVLVIPKGFEDQSWHNDVCPHVVKSIMDYKNTSIEMRIWQDYKDPALRERENKRYLFQIHIYTDVLDDILLNYETNEWKEIEKLIDMVQYPLIPERSKKT